MQSAVALSKVIHQKGLMQDIQIFLELFYCSTASSERLGCECGACLCHAARVVPQTAPNSLKQILFCLFTSVMWGLSTQKLMLVLNGKNSMPTSSCCTPMLCMGAFSGVHTQVKVNYVRWSVTATYKHRLQTSCRSITYYLSQQLCFMCLLVPLCQG